MGGFICVALIVIALVWDKFRRIFTDLDVDNAIAQGKKQKNEKK